MATYTKLSSGSWRVQVRRKGRYVSETFLRRDDARRWATNAERQIDLGETPSKSRVARLKTFGQLIDLHIGDMCDWTAPGLADNSLPHAAALSKRDWRREIFTQCPVAIMLSPA